MQVPHHIIVSKLIAVWCNPIKLRESPEAHCYREPTEMFGPRSEGKTFMEGNNAMGLDNPLPSFLSLVDLIEGGRRHTDCKVGDFCKITQAKA